MSIAALFLFQAVNDLLPKLARKEVDRLIAELQDAQFKLEFTPTTTLEFVQNLTFLDEIQVRVSRRSPILTPLPLEMTFVAG